MFRTLLLILLVAASSSLSAPVEVRTGEHGNFTRVVLYIGSDTQWSLDQTDDGYRIATTAQDGFAIDSFFELIPRTRISGVEQNLESGELLLTLNCDCIADAFRYRPGVLVIDVKDGITPKWVLVDTNDIRENPPSILPVLFTDRDREDGTASPKAPTAIVAKQSEDDLMGPLAFLSNAVAGGLGRAMAQGLLARNLRAARHVDPAKNAPVAVEAFGVNIATSIDQPSIRIDDDRISNGMLATCAPNEYFAVSSWGDSRPFNEQISELRSAVTNEADQPDKQALLDLAKLYVHFGYGVEARQILDRKDLDTLEYDILSTVARISDGETVNSPTLQMQSHCGPQAAFWAFVGLADVYESDAANPRELMNTYLSLPPWLQKTVQIELGERLRQIGEGDIARQVFSIHASDARLPNLGVSNNSDLTRALAEVTNSDPDAKALARIDIGDALDLMRDKLAENEALTDDESVLINSIKFQSRDDKRHPELLALHIRLLISRGAIDKAQKALADHSPDLYEDDRDALKSEMASAVINGPDDAYFLNFVFQIGVNEYGADLTDLIAVRLCNLGFGSRSRYFGGAGNDCVDQSVPAETAENFIETAEVSQILADSSLPSDDANLPVVERPAGNDPTYVSSLLSESSELRAGILADVHSVETE